MPAPAAKLPRKTPKDLSAPALSENALVVLRRRYLERDENGEPGETPRDMFWRVARHVAAAEAQHGGDPKAMARAFYTAMAKLEFVPSSPTLMNAGRPIGQLAACFVLPIDDSLESIFDTLKHAALVHQSGGGTGFDFSKLRPQGDAVKSTHGVASGPLSFLRIYNASTEEIKQGGARRGANMGVLRVDHPDILRFIDAKRTLGAIENFNLSVAVTDDFMDALRRGAKYDLVHPKTGATAGSLRAADVFHHIAEAAWASGEPGLLFIDRVNDKNPVSHVETIAASNPCGEQFLAPYDSCILGSIDLARHTKKEGDETVVDWNHLRETIHLAVRFLDDVLDVQTFPLPEIKKKTLSNRRIGLGVMGFARMLFRLGIPYDSETGLATAEKVMAFFEKEAHAMSERLAKQRGVFPAWKGSAWHKAGRKMRNAAVTTVAPTGTIGMIADTSGGCEPEFSLVYVKRCLDGTTFPYVVPEVEAVAKREGFWRSTLLQEIADNKGSLRGLPKIPERWQKVFANAHDIAPDDHVRMQAAFQRHIDNAVSKTINLPKAARPEDIERAFRLAYELGCKGITVYREGTRPSQVLQHASGKDPPTGSVPEDFACVACNVVPEGVPARGPQPAAQATPKASAKTTATASSERNIERRTANTGTMTAPAQQETEPTARRSRLRPNITRGWTHKLPTGCGDLYVTISEDNEGIAEIIAVRARANACTSAHLEATSRLASLALRSGVAVEDVARALRGVRCGEPHVGANGIVFGCVDAIGQALERQALGENGPRHEVTQQPPLARFDAAPLAAPPRSADTDH